MEDCFLNIDEVSRLLEDYSVVWLLCKQYVLMIVVFLWCVFCEECWQAYGSQELNILLFDFLFVVNEGVGEGGKFYFCILWLYLEDWIKDGFLWQYYEVGVVEVIFEFIFVVE